MPCFAVRTVNDSACLGKRICVSSGDRTAHLPVGFSVQSATEPRGRNQGCFFVSLFFKKSTYDAWIWQLSLMKPDVQPLIGCEDRYQRTEAVSEDSRGPFCSWSGVWCFNRGPAATTNGSTLAQVLSTPLVPRREISLHRRN